MVLEYTKRPNRRRLRRGTEPLQKEANRAVKNLIITLALMITALTIGFIATLNGSSQRGYTLEQEKLRNEHLKTAQANLNTKITKETAFSEIKDEKTIQEMQPDPEKEYVTPEDNAVK